MHKKIVTIFLVASLLLSTPAELFALRRSTARKVLGGTAVLATIASGLYSFKKNRRGGRTQFSLGRFIPCALVSNLIVTALPIAASYCWDLTTEAEYETLCKDIERALQRENILTTKHLDQQTLESYIAEHYMSYGPRAALMAVKADCARAITSIKILLERLEKIRLKVEEDGQFVVSCKATEMRLTPGISYAIANNNFINQLL